MKNLHDRNQVSPATMKTYTIGTNPSNGRTTLTLNVDVGSFSVWRDLGRLAGVATSLNLKYGLGPT